MPRIFISDSTAGGTHGATIRSAILANHPGLVSADITLQLNASYLLASVLADMATAFNDGYEAFIHCSTLSPQLAAQAQSYWEQSQTMRVIVPLGNNSHVNLPYSPDERGPMVTCGASDGANNETAYGEALWFFDDDNGNPGDASSFSTGVIAGKLLYIKDQRGSDWWEALYAAIQTASENAAPTLNNGYGIIDTSAAISWSGDVPWDPYLPIGDVGTLAGSAVGATATLTADAVDNATIYYLEYSIDSGASWSIQDTKPGRIFTVTLQDGISTQFRSRAGNPGGVTEYSNTVTLEYNATMADKRQQILDAIVTRLQTIATATYRTNAGSNVYLERVAPVAENECPAIIVSDAGSPPDIEGMGGNTSRWYYLLRVKLDIKAAGATAGTVMRKVKEDIKQAIGTDETFGGLANWTHYVDDSQEYDHEELKVTAGSIDIQVRYYTNKWDSD